MGAFIESHELFGEVRITKKAKDLATHAAAQAAKLETKIAARRARVVEIRKLNALSDRDMSDLAQQALADRNAAFYSLASNVSKPRVAKKGDTTGEARIIPAGVVAQIQAELGLVANEGKQVETLRLMERTMRGSKDTIPCSLKMLEYLGF